MDIPKDNFLEIIDQVPLVSIDLIIENANQQYLLGMRNNKPAQGSWFVPGGRIRKNETIAAALARISMAELGVALTLEYAELLGTYDHIYDDNYHGLPNINTHYVVLGYKVKLPTDQNITLDEQHSDIKWFTKDALLADNAVHQNTKNYFL